tara:strand:- start:31 stop:159 length:129 start_codon:yes stop_codon:yes gene_type:complete
MHGLIDDACIAGYIEDTNTKMAEKIAMNIISALLMTEGIFSR